MKKAILTAGLVCVLGLCLMKLPLMAYPQPTQISQVAGEAVTELAHKNFASFFTRLDNTMKSTMPAAKLPGIWESVIAQVGAFKSLGLIRQEKSGSYDVVYVTCQFEKAPLDIRLEFDANHQIAGLFFSPASASHSSASAASPTEPAQNGVADVSASESPGD
jgi:uncharacterized protein